LREIREMGRSGEDIASDELRNWVGESRNLETTSRLPLSVEVSTHSLD